MSQLAGTTDTYRIGTAGGLREDLEDVIWDLFADQTLMLSRLDKVESSGTYHEWLTDVLVAATQAPAIEGDDFAAVTIAAPTRVGAFQQINKKQFLVSNTLEAVNKAGRRREQARQAMKQMRELKNDMEYCIVRNSASTAGGSATARSTAGMESWLATNEILATTSGGSTTVGFSSGTVAAPTDGSTTGALTIASLNAALLASWQQGGNPSLILTNATQKAVLDQFTGIATRFVDNGRSQQATIINAASMYVTSYGTHALTLHRHVRGSTVLCIDPDYWAISFLRRPFSEELAKTGDGRRFHIVTEWGVVSRNEKASAKIVNAT